MDISTLEMTRMTYTRVAGLDKITVAVCQKLIKLTKFFDLLAQVKIHAIDSIWTLPPAWLL